MKQEFASKILTSFDVIKILGEITMNVRQKLRRQTTRCDKEMCVSD